MTPAFVTAIVLMVLAAIAALVYPLLKPMPGAGTGESLAPKAAPLAFALAVAIGLGAVGLYAKVNSFPWDNPAATAPAGHDATGAARSMEQVTAALEKRLQQNPNDLEGWRTLGRTYLMTGNSARAVQAYEQANSLAPAKDTGLLLDLAEALVLTDDPAMQPRAQAIVDDVLATDATNQKALWYRGVMAVRAGDNETAKISWTRLLDTNPPPEIRDVIANQLTELGAVSVAKGRTVRVAINVDPSLAGRLQPGVALFVAVREPGIPGPPIAVKRLTTDELPATVVLSDADSMIQGRDLSSVKDVEIVARVAFGGTAATASGDLVGRALQKADAGENVTVVINQVQP